MTGIRLGTNIDSLAAQSELNSATSTLTKSYQRLSSGLRINQASDDAAGLSIVSQLNSKSQVFTQAIRNVNDGVSASNIAEGALTALKTISQRQLELAEQAANGAYSLKQRQSLNTEANALVDEYNRIVSTTTFNGLNLLDPSLGTVLIQAGYGQTGALQLQLSNQLERPVGDGTFAGAITVSTGGNVTGVISADLNGDGNADIVATNAAGTISVFLGNGNETFRSAQNFTVGTTANFTVAADFNNDGKLDLLSIGTGNTPTVLLGNGDGTFQAAVSYPGSNVSAPVVGDFNGDGNLDFAATVGNGFVSAFLGNGNGTFKAPASYATVALDVGVMTGDFNNDGKSDIAVLSVSGTTQVLFANGDGTFAAPVTLSSGNQFEKYGLSADINGDGLTDLVTANYNNQVFVYLSNGNGTFKAPITSHVNGNVNGIVSADINGDGKPDIVASGGNAGISILLSNGDGTFGAVQSIYSGAQSARNVAVGDFTGDGRYDVVTNFNYAAGSVEVFAGNGNYTSTAPYLNINTQQGARDALNTVTANLNRVEAQLGVIGATTSRFQFEIGNLKTETENYDAAAGRIQDVDVAQESANLVRTQILQQAAASVLAQANQEPQLALKLIG